MHSMRIDPTRGPESDPILEIDETVHDLTRLESNELRVCRFHINSKMLRRGYGGYDLVRPDFTSLVYAALASEVDILAGDGNLAAQ